MKTRKTVIAVLVAVLLVSAALIVGCMNQLDGISDKDAEDDYPIPEGKGRIKFKITDGNARTILPTANVANMYFTFTFTDVSGGSTNGNIITLPSTGRTGYSSSIPLVLPESTYTASVTAYNAASDGQVISGWDSGLTSYTISAGNLSNSVNVTLEGVIDGLGQGLFTYSITVPSISQPDNTTITYIPNGTDINSMTMKVTKGITNTYILSEGVNTQSPAGGILLDSGVYTITVTLKANNCQPRVINTVMHIYNGLTSNYNVSVAAPVQNLFTVKFDTSPTGSAVSQASVQNADTASKPSSDPTNSNTSLEFDDWYVASGGSTKFNFSSKIFRDTTIFAHWKPAAGNGPLGIVVTFTPISADVATLTPSGANIDYDTVLAGGMGSAVTFTVGGIDTDITWLLDGDDISSKTASGVLTFSDILNNDLLDALAAGTHYLTVSGKKSPSTTIYSATYEFTATYP